jgi:hypothetical protein
VPLADGPKKFVDNYRGKETNDGSEKKPWRSLTHALRQLVPGDTLYLRGGVYYEKLVLSRSGTEAQPITIASYPGEAAIIDGGLREFADHPSSSWEPFSGGAADEYVSTKTYADVDARRVPTQFLPGSWEPLWGIEDQRPLALGAFAPSMVPLHGYRTVEDLRASNEFWLGGKNEDRDVGNYCGPGLWFNRETGRIHCRLAHTKLAGLGDHAYRGETDPRRVSLVVALGFGDDVVRLVGINHIVLRDLTFRGATGSPLLHLYGSQHVTLDHVTAFGGFPAVLINASQNIRVVNSAFRGSAAPWTSRAHMKYRGTPTYMLELQNNQPTNENIEFAHCEFADDHDFAFFRYVKNLQFHHNFVDNFNDDGIECGPKLRDHTMFIHENRLGRMLIPFSQHEMWKDEAPVDHDPNSGAFVYRNVVDLRGGTYKSPPKEPDASGSFLHEAGHFVGDHGGPVWAVLHVYQNTVLRDGPVFRDSFLFGLAGLGLKNSERDALNNILVQMGAVPGAGFVALKEAGNTREGGNLLWGLAGGPEFKGDLFVKFRASPLFEQSKRYYAPGWTTDDRVADPKFVALSAEGSPATDLRLTTGSPAVNSGVDVPAEWPDPLREEDKGKPDSGALPLGAKSWGVGVDGRLSLFTGK